MYTTRMQDSVRIGELLARDWKICLNHVYRESNMCVDWLAKFGANCNEQLVQWESPLGGISSLLLPDTIGIGYYRN